MHMNQEPTFRWDQGLEEPARTIAALDHTPIRVLAGPGTGKTFAMMRRVARLLQEGSNPDKILVCTFARMAADDLRKELSALNVAGVDTVHAGTLHSYCFRLLRQSEVLDTTGRIARPLLKFEERFLLKDLSLEISEGIRRLGRRLDTCNAAWACRQSDEPGWPAGAKDKKFQVALNRWLKFHEAILIGELVPEALRYLSLNPVSPHREKFEHVLIDEYQDLNKAEQVLLDLLAENGQLIVIGDEDQSIYSFKFAHPEGIANFDKSHPGTRDFKLDECRRCPRRVVELANSLICNNERHESRTLKARPINPEGEVLVLQWEDMEKEAQGIAKIIHDRVQNKKIKLREVLVLSPRRQFGDLVRDHLRTSGIPAQSFFREKVLERSNDAQQAFTLLALMANSDDRVALRCWCGLGSNSLRKRSWKRLWDHCNNSGDTPRMALERLISGELSIRYAHHLVKPYLDLQGRLKELENVHGQALVDAIFPSDSDKNWARPFRDLASNIQEDEFNAQKLREFLRVSISPSELPTDVDYIRVMSLYRSKGLTAKLVVVVGCIEGLIPRLPSEEKTPEEQRRILEEERRLFYVAITRCTQSLILSSAARLPRDLAHQLRANILGNNWTTVPAHTSSFLSDLRPTLPSCVSGSEFLEEVGL